jgi:hypothetical protein
MALGVASIAGIQSRFHRRSRGANAAFESSRGRRHSKGLGATGRGARRGLERAAGRGSRG